MSKNITDSEQNYSQVVNQAVAQLLRETSTEELIEDLNGLFQGYLRSDFSNDRNDRSSCSFAYEVMRNFLRVIEKCESQNRNQFISKLENQASC